MRELDEARHTDQGSVALLRRRKLTEFSALLVPTMRSHQFPAAQRKYRFAALLKR
jgi:hypothetical protein